MRNHTLRFSFLALAALAGSIGLFGCAIGTAHRYSEAVAVLQATGNAPVAVAIHDRRPAAVSGEIQPNVTGYVRGYWFNKIDASTASGAPLAEDMTRAICNSLKKRGFDAVAVKTSPGDSPEEVEKKLGLSGADRSILIELNEWQSETWFRTIMNYNAQIAIRKASAKRKAQNNQSGRENLGARMFTPAENARQQIPEFLKRKIEEWLNDPSAIEILP